MKTSRRHIARAAAFTAAAALAGIASGGIAYAGGPSSGSSNGGFGPAPKGRHVIQPLKHECTTGQPEGLCRNIGVTDGWYDGSTTKFLYTQNFYCDPSVSAGSDNGCEAGQKFNHVPPGTTSEAFTDPLYIPVPLFTPGPEHLQCPAGKPCVDHPKTIDLSRLASALGKPADQLKNVMLPGHDHIIDDRNDNRPEWWPVYVIGVSNPDSFKQIEDGKSLDVAQKLAADPNSGVTQPIPTNVFLWFQTLPGTEGGHGHHMHGGAEAGGGGTQAMGMLAGPGSAVAGTALLGGALFAMRRRMLAGRES